MQSYDIMTEKTNRKEANRPRIIHFSFDLLPIQIPLLTIYYKNGN